MADFLAHLRKDIGLSQAQFAAGIQSMHGYPGQITEETIRNLEDVYSGTKYPRSLLEEVALYCTRQLSKEHSRLIEYQDIVSFSARVVSDDDYAALQAQQAQQAVEEPESDTAPTLPVAG